MHNIQEFRQIVTSEQFDLASFAETARRYESAKARLLAAQQEKMEAAAELMTLREALARYFDAFWPGQPPVPSTT